MSHQERGQLIRDLQLRAARSTYLVLSAILSPVFLVWVAVALRGSWSSAWQGVAIVGALWAAFVLYFATLQVTIRDGSLSYRTLAGTRSLALPDIAHSSLHVSVTDYRPILVVTAVGGGRALRINLKPFRGDDIRDLLAHPALKYVKSSDVA